MSAGIESHRSGGNSGSWSASRDERRASQGKSHKVWMRWKVEGIPRFPAVSQESLLCMAHASSGISVGTATFV